ncbi:MAG: FMN-binding protein [Duodenibacillus sp.]|nr:FMN-binding protein [Duodenibacillus sp.]
MKKILVAAAALALCAGAQAAYKDGSYTGEGQGKEGKITVQVDVAGGKIASVKVVKHTDTQMLLDVAAKKVGKAIVAKQGTEGVKAVAGASLSSKGIIEAVNNALATAK